MTKTLVQTVKEIEVMISLLNKQSFSTKTSNLVSRTVGDIDRISNTAWLNLYDHLFENGVEPELHFKAFQTGDKCKAIDSFGGDVLVFVGYAESLKFSNDCVVLRGDVAIPIRASHLTKIDN